MFKDLVENNLDSNKDSTGRSGERRILVLHLSKSTKNTWQMLHYKFQIVPVSALLLH